MSALKKLSTLVVLILAGILIFPFTGYSQGYMMGNYGNNWCNNYSANSSNLTKVQSNKVNKIQQDYFNKIEPLREKLSSLQSKAYNYSNINTADLSKIKQYHKQLRELNGKIDDLQLDETAAINKVLPKDQQGNYNNYYAQCYGYNNNGNTNGYGMMWGYGMMNGGMGSMMYGGRGYGMMGGRYGMGSMMNGYGMGGMMQGYRNNR